MLDAIKMLVDRWKDLDFRPKKEDDRCPKCGSDVKAFRGQKCYTYPNFWHLKK
jgi:hypothetical protein